MGCQGWLGLGRLPDDAARQVVLTLSLSEVLQEDWLYGSCLGFILELKSTRSPIPPKISYFLV